ncbi:uncharacterized protein LOC134848716 [Symsagittifera roscoffensis]|uniref:uncharacterized protein LOC134848716 n=1 Tax=Symsagittifera roscoffensis TaxID=84072 RepID=UPI00307BE19F
MPNLTLSHYGFYLTLFDTSAYAGDPQKESAAAAIYTEWKPVKFSYSDLGYKSDAERDDDVGVTSLSVSNKEQQEQERSLKCREVSLEVVETAIKEQLSIVRQELDEFKVCAHASDDIAVTLLALSLQFHSMEPLVDFFKELLTNLEYNGLLLSPTLKNLTANAACLHVLQSMLNYIMDETFKTWCDVHNINNQPYHSRPSSQSRGSFISAGPHSIAPSVTSSFYEQQTSNWLTECGYYEMWQGQEKTSGEDLIAELMGMINACEQEINAIRKQLEATERDDVVGVTSLSVSNKEQQEQERSLKCREVSLEVVETAVKEQLSIVRQELDEFKVCAHAFDDIAVTLLALSLQFHSMEPLVDFFKELLTNLEYNGLLLSPTLKNLTANAACLHVLQSMLNYIMDETFKTWCDVHNINNQPYHSRPSSQSRGSFISAGPHSIAPSVTSSFYEQQTSNWLTECGYYEMWQGQEKTSEEDLIAELMGMINACEQEINAIRKGYREFSRAKNSILIPVEDWDLEASTEGGSQGGVADSQVPRAMSELQTLDHLVQQAQIVQFKLDRLELLSLREARQLSSSDLVIKQVEDALSRQRSALHHLNSSFVIEADIIFDETEGLISRNGNNEDSEDGEEPITSQQGLLIPRAHPVLAGPLVYFQATLGQMPGRETPNQQGGSKDSRRKKRNCCCSIL